MSMDAEAQGAPPGGQKVALEVAEAEFERFVAAMDLDVDESTMDDADKKSFREERAKVIDAMLEGRLTVNADGEPVFTPKKGDTTPIKFPEPSGAAIMAQDSKKKGHDVAKSFAVMAAMTGEPPTRFANMAGRDIKVCNALLVLFMAG